MPDEHPAAETFDVERFWHNCLSILDKTRVSQAARSWYRKHAKAYKRAHAGLRLAAHSPGHIDDYQNAKGRMAGVSEWRFRQLADVLRVPGCAQARRTGTAFPAMLAKNPPPAEMSAAQITGAGMRGNQGGSETRPYEVVIRVVSCR